MAQMSLCSTIASWRFELLSIEAREILLSGQPKKALVILSGSAAELCL